VAGIRGFWVAGAALLGLMLAACGGSSGSGTNTEYSPGISTFKLPTAPVSKTFARAQGPKSTLVGERVALDGAESYSEDSLITYRWSLSAPAKSSSTLDSMTSPKAQFIPDVSGSYKATLVVTNESGETSETSVNVDAVISNANPVARIDYPQYVNIKNGSLVTLDGSKSRDPNGNAMTYYWTIKRSDYKEYVANPNENLANPTDITKSAISFTGKEGAYLVSLRVFNGMRYDYSDTAAIVVTTDNSPPIANPGMDKFVTLGSAVKLDGGASKDPDLDGLTYRWSLVSRPTGSSVVFVSTSINPEFKTDIPGSYVLGLKVSDGILESQLKTVTIFASASANAPPSASAGVSQTAEVGALVTFDGGGSIDPNGQELTYAWNIKSKPNDSYGILVGSKTRNPTIRPDKAGEYVLSLVVSDGIEQSEESITKLTATSASQSILPIPPSGSYCCWVCTIG